MTERLPTPGGDNNVWAAILNGYLTVSIAADGTLKAHAANHKAGGFDSIKLDELAAPTDVTTLNASTSAHGLMRKLDGNAAHYFDGTGAFSTPAGGGGGALPSGIYDAVVDLGLVDDATTDNSAALQTFVDSVPDTGNGRYAEVWFPFTNTGRYKFNTVITCGAKPILFKGSGWHGYTAPQYMTTIIGGTAGMTIFDATTGTGDVHWDSPSFENLLFNVQAGSNVVGINNSGANHMIVRNCNFLGTALNGIGIQLSESPGGDSAYHHFSNLAFVGCNYGINSIYSNSWWLFGARAEACFKGIYLAQGTNQVYIAGVKINSGGLNSRGIHINGYGNTVVGIAGELQGGTGRALVELSGNGDNNNPDLQQGYGNHVDIIAHDGGGAGTCLLIGAGATQNTWRISPNAANGTILTDGGVNNGPSGGAMMSTAAKRPAATKRSAGRFHFATDTGVLSVGDESPAWKSSVSAVTVKTMVTDQTISASTTLVDLTNLYVALTGDNVSQYFVEAFLMVSAANATMDLKLGWTAGGVALVNWGTLNGSVVTPTWGSVAVGTSATLWAGAAASISVGTVAFGTTGQLVSVAAFIGDNGNAANVYLRAAQDTSDAGALTIIGRSFIRITKVT